MASIVGPVSVAGSFAPPGPVGGTFAALGVTALGQLKSTPGILARILPLSVGSAGTLQICDQVAGTYAAGTAYLTGNCVLYSGVLYWANQATTGNLPTNATYWNTVAPATQIVYQAAFNAASMVAGTPITLEWPCAAGILVSLVPSAGSPVYSISFS
jgi:hypothetical protein